MINGRIPPLTVVEPPRVLRLGDPGAAGSGPDRGRPAAIWDLDGTLTRTDTLVPFLRRVAGTAAVFRALTAAARELPHRDAVKALVLQRLLGGREATEVDRVARRYAERLMAAQVRTDSLHQWLWHRRNRHRMIIASASPGLYVRHLGRLLGADEVICTEMAVVNGRLTGAIAGGNCRGPEKARRVREYLAAKPAAQVWAYADGDVDTPLLELADVGVRVRPYRRIRTGEIR
ncbi:HAD-IB family hydrolase [Actinoplanes sp. HUAS TT8]|uniref:HAD-IB family hydrolase n=1 Tax=Actinoplanes sp. HUAS TT8 TaxID=3447453 RepID=UPI003F51D17B